MSADKNWKDSVVYQIYPRSFNDSNSDGEGDLRGIIEKVPYLSDLGVNVVWLSPVYATPNDDNGYDISDYYKINPDFGTMEDMDELIRVAKDHGIKLLMDLVVNHSSDEHEWFKKAKADKNSKYHDYYIWSEGKERPNNWRGFFQGSVWEWNEATQEYYLHLFTKKQPDLNWENPELREEIYKMMRFWLDKGVGGFRMDVCNLYKKPDLYKDSPVDPDVDGWAFDPDLYANNEGINEIFQEMNREVFSKYDCFTVGETTHVHPHHALEYVSPERKELDMVFHFQHVGLQDKSTKNIKEIYKNWFTVMEHGGWNSNYFSNHDQPRSLSAFGNDKEYRKESATLLGTINFTLPGTPYIYQGEEIGMSNMMFEDFFQFDDVETLKGIEIQRKEGKSDDEILAYWRKNSRDNARTPIQWDSTKNGGFTDGNPWLVVNPNYKDVNTAAQINDKTSIRSYYQKLISLRKEHEVMVHGDCEFILDSEDGAEDLIALMRVYKEQVMIALMNRSDYSLQVEAGADLKAEIDGGTVALNNYAFINGESSTGSFKLSADGNIELKPWQAVIILLN